MFFSNQLSFIVNSNRFFLSCVLRCSDALLFSFFCLIFRYPEDPSDRIWKSEAQPTGGIINATTVFHDRTRVPIKVLQTATASSDRLVFLTNGLDIIQNNYTIFLYFLELNSSTGVGQRVFDIYVNSEKTWSGFDIQGQGSIYHELALNVTASVSLNLTLVKVSNESVLFGPICNAYEILQVHPWVQESLPGDGK